MKRLILVLVLGLFGCDDGAFPVAPADGGTDTGTLFASVSASDDVTSTDGSWQVLATADGVQASRLNVASNTTGTANGSVQCEVAIFVDGAIVPDSIAVTSAYDSAIWSISTVVDIVLQPGLHVVSLRMQAVPGTSHTCAVRILTNGQSESTSMTITSH